MWTEISCLLKDCQHRSLSPLYRAQIRAIHKTGKFSRIQIQGMLGVCSRGLAKALENAPKGDRKDNPENDDELLSPEFATALATGKPTVIKNFVDNQEKRRNDAAANKKSTADRNADQAPSTKKTRNIPSRTEHLVPSSTSSSFEKDDALSRNGEENTRRFFAELRSLSLQRRKPAITIPPIGESIPLTLLPKDNTQSATQATTPPTTTHPIDPLPMPHATNNAFPSPSTNSLTAEVTNVVPPLLPSSLPVSDQELSAGASEPHPSPEQRSQNFLLPAAADSHEIQPNADQHPFDTSSFTLKSESRDPTPEVEEVSATRDAIPNSSPLRSFLSSLQPPLAQYAPAFEKLGVKNSDELLILKSLAPASIREFLQEVRKETDMTFLQSLAFLGGLERYSP